MRHARHPGGLINPESGRSDLRRKRLAMPGAPSTPTWTTTRADCRACPCTRMTLAAPGRTSRRPPPWATPADGCAPMCTRASSVRPMHSSCKPVCRHSTEIRQCSAGAGTRPSRATPCESARGRCAWRCGFGGAAVRRQGPQHRYSWRPDSATGRQAADRAAPLALQRQFAPIGGIRPEKAARPGDTLATRGAGFARYLGATARRGAGRSRQRSRLFLTCRTGIRPTAQNSFAA